MTEQPTEKTITELCNQAGDACAGAVGKVCAGQGPDVAHIVLMSAASTLMCMAAQTIVRNKTGQHPAPTDPEVVKIYRYWIREMDRFPDVQAIALQLTAIREDYYLGIIEEPPPSARDMLVFMQKVAGMVDPSNTKDVWAENAIWAEIIDEAKGIVGDYSEEVDADGD